MGKPSEDSRKRFAKLAGKMAKVDGSAPSYREGFGSGALFVGRKMFGVLDESGALVLKLPPARVQELIADGTGAPWHPGTGKPLKEYVAVAAVREAKWLKLAQEARAYMASKA